MNIKTLKINWGYMRYYFRRQEAGAERFAFLIKFLTAEMNAVPNAARKYTAKR
jgi:hypothetical protein